MFETTTTVFTEQLSYILNRTMLYSNEYCSMTALQLPYPHPRRVLLNYSRHIIMFLLYCKPTMRHVRTHTQYISQIGL